MKLASAEASEPVAIAINTELDHRECPLESSQQRKRQSALSGPDGALPSDFHVEELCPECNT